MSTFTMDVIVFDDHEFRGGAVQAMIEATRMVRSCNLHNCNFETDLEPGFTSVRIVTTNGRRGLGIYVAGGMSLIDPHAISRVSNIHAYYPDIAVVALRDDCSIEDIASALHLGLQGLIPTYLPKKTAITALEFVMGGGHYFPYSCIDPEDAEGLAGFKVVEPVGERSHFGLAIASRCWSEAMEVDDPAAVQIRL